MDLKEQIKQQLEENQKSKGFGDTFEKIMIFTGIKRFVMDNFPGPRDSENSGSSNNNEN